MKRALLLIFLDFLLQTSFAQETLGVNEYLELLDVNPNKLANYLEKKGFRKAYLLSDEESGLGFIKTTKLKDATLTQCFKFSRLNDGLTLSYETSILSEYKNLKDELIHKGYSYAPLPVKDKKDCILFQKNNVSIESDTEVKDNVTMYTFSATKIDLPKLKKIKYAEDLLTFNSHECLDAVFGKENVRKDVLYYSDTETNKCSVIFPNTEKEAIFVWNDETNYRDIAFIVFGGRLKTLANTENVNQVIHNEWLSKQGIYCGMSLPEVQALNKESISFYNWKTESAGFVVPKNKGALDFERLGMTLNCLNCSYVERKETNIIQSEEAIQENQKVFVSSMVVLPEKRNKDKVYTSLR
jgi:hypothetical protein